MNIEYLKQKFEGMTNPYKEVTLPSVVGNLVFAEKKTPKPKAYPMPLQNPKSAWGKRMAEKLAQKS